LVVESIASASNRSEGRAIVVIDGQIERNDGITAHTVLQGLRVNATGIISLGIKCKTFAGGFSEGGCSAVVDGEVEGNS
jgi:hypothetical protein